MAHVLAPERVMSAKTVTRAAGSQPGDRKDRLLEDLFQRSTFRPPHPSRNSKNWYDFSKNLGPFNLRN